ncbi:YwiC-like family protein [Neobacillus sp. D3-1R]|uniref:YwiC-like family protein n=1 Tax=Neobacillus sp. D3-1R TaxID=3445778 RepID=UPI003F9F34BC
MKVFLPKQHGAWAMLIIPFWLGVAATSMIWQHVPFFIGWLFLYLATYPMLLLFKGKKMAFHIKWSFIYMVPALLFLSIPIWHQPKLFYFGIMMIPFFFINAYYSSRNQDRSLGNDVSAVFTFAIAGVASGYLVSEEMTANIILVFITSFLFFIGCTFYVKTMIREKKNHSFKWVSWGYHLFATILWILLGEWLIFLAFLPSLIRSIVFYGRSISAKKVGIYEIINAAIFFCFIFIRLILG